jgi:hypothetical protein
MNMLSSSLFALLLSAHCKMAINVIKSLLPMTLCQFDELTQYFMMFNGIQRVIRSTALTMHEENQKSMCHYI